MLLNIIKVFLVMVLFNKVYCKAVDTYYESVIMDVIADRQLYSFFNFTTSWEFVENFAPQHYHLFPRAFGELMQKYQVAELHFTMTQGLWRYNQWGMPYASAPTGAQLWVWFDASVEDVDKNWTGFTNALSGIFCASLKFINKAIFVAPNLTFRPTGALKDGMADSKYLRYGTLSREILCTENLTPWMKLLPCGYHAGPASLLNPSQLHHSKFLSMGIHFSTVCNDPHCSKTVVQLQQHISVVFDIPTSKDQLPNFTFMTLFQRKLKPACKLATVSQLKLYSPIYTEISPSIEHTDGLYKVKNLLEFSKETNFALKWKKKPSLVAQMPEGITSHCFVTGLGLDGGLTCTLTNNLPSNVTVVFLQIIPWFLFTHIHTLQIKNGNGQTVVPLLIDFKSAKIRKAPHKLELVLTLSANEETILKIRFTRGFLTWTEHPPDANHGFYISPSCITVKTSDINVPRTFESKVQRIYSESLLVNIPVPDFSMPYNVICLVCTVVAVAFGSLHNLTTRRLQKVSPSRKSTAKMKFYQFLEKLGFKSFST